MMFVKLFDLLIVALTCCIRNGACFCRGNLTDLYAGNSIAYVNHRYFSSPNGDVICKMVGFPGLHNALKNSVNIWLTNLYAKLGIIVAYG